MDSPQILRYCGYIISLIAALRYLWNGHDYFNKKAWIGLLLKVLAVYAVTIALFALIARLRTVYPDITRHMAESIVLPLWGSLMTLLGLKFLVALKTTMWIRSVGLHKLQSSPENRQKIIELANSSPWPMKMLKGLLSVACVLMLYGVWLAADGFSNPHA